MTSSWLGPHLGDDSSAFVDGELTPAGRERALTHLVGCEQCRGEVDGQRRLKATLSGLSKTPDAPMPSQELTARLLRLPKELAAPVTATDHASHPLGEGMRAPAAGTVPAAGPRRRRDSRRPSVAVRPYRRAGRRGKYVAGSIGALTAGLALVLAVGGESSAAGVRVRPPMTGFVQQHAVSTDEIPYSDPVEAVVTAAFSR